MTKSHLTLAVATIIFTTSFAQAPTARAGGLIGDLIEGACGGCGLGKALDKTHHNMGKPLDKAAPVIAETIIPGSGVIVGGIQKFNEFKNGSAFQFNPHNRPIQRGPVRSYYNNQQLNLPPVIKQFNRQQQMQQQQPRNGFTLNWSFNNRKKKNYSTNYQLPHGNYCITPKGKFGPIPTKPIGAPCHANTPYGVFYGQVTR